MKTTIEFSESSSLKLAKLASRLETSKAEVLRSALILYSYVANEVGRRSDKFLGVISLEDDRDNIEKIVVIPGLQNKEVIEMKRPKAPQIIVAATASGD